MSQDEDDDDDLKWEGSELEELLIIPHVIWNEGGADKVKSDPRNVQAKKAEKCRCCKVMYKKIKSTLKIICGADDTESEPNHDPPQVTHPPSQQPDKSNQGHYHDHNNHNDHENPALAGKYNHHHHHHPQGKRPESAWEMWDKIHDKNTNKAKQNVAHAMPTTTLRKVTLPDQQKPANTSKAISSPEPGEPFKINKTDANKKSVSDKDKK